MSELLQPTVALTETARQQAIDQDVHALTFHRPGLEAIASLAGQPPEAVNDITIAFGGVRKWPRPIKYDWDAHYSVVHENNGSVRPVSDKHLPPFIHADHPHTRLIVCPVPKTWTAEEISAALYKGIHKEPHPARLIAGINTITTSIGAVAGGIYFPEHGIEPAWSIALGGALGLMAGGGSTIFTGPIMAARRSNNIRKAKKETVFNVYSR